MMTNWMSATQHVLYPLEPPQEVTTVSTDTSVLVSWQALDPPPDSYRITITYTNITSTSNLAFTITIQVLGTATEVEYSQLIPQQQYTCCVIAVYDSLTSHTCRSFQTNTSLPSPNSSPSPSPSPSACPSPSPSPSACSCPSTSTCPSPSPSSNSCPSPSACPNPSPNSSPSPSTCPSPSPSPSPCSSLNTGNSNSTQLVLVGGVLGFVIALLVLLLVVAGVGLAYLQCVRSRGKDNSR